MSTNLAVATEILRQLGGNRFLTMTGMHNLVGTENALGLQFRSNPKGYAKMWIVLTPMDDYRLEFYVKLGTFDYKLAKVVHNVYCDNLEDVFETETGLYTHL